MSVVIDSQTISEEERERVLARAESDPVFRDLAHLSAELVDQHGYPERNVEDVFADNRDLIVLFRMYRTSMQVNRRLAGRPPEERLTEKEWEERRTTELRKQMMASMQQASSQLTGMANAFPSMGGIASPGSFPSLSKRNSTVDR